MRVTKGIVSLISDLIIDTDLDMLGSYQVKNLASPATGEALRKGNKDIANAEVADAAAIALGKLHGDVASEAEVVALIADAVAAGIDAVTLDGYEVFDLSNLATVEAFQHTPATGTMGSVGNINNNNTATVGQADTIDKYGEVDFVVLTVIKRFRHYGYTGNVGNGSWKIQYWDGTDWQDWETGIATRTTADWSAYVSPAAGIKLTTKVRLVCTAVDDLGGGGAMGELEIIY